MYSPIERTRVFEQIVKQIERRILTGELRHGDYLGSERELAEQFGASRTAVREALKTLAQRGLVDMRPGRGTMVIDGTSQAMRHSLHLMMRIGSQHTPTHLTEVREILEPEIAALAAERVTDEHIAALRVAVDTMEHSLDDASAFIAADNEFHRALARGSGNPLILALVDSIVDLLSDQRKMIFTTLGGPQRGQMHHKRVLNAIVARDPEAARVSMRAHMDQVREDSRQVALDDV
ncbi:MAG TPA: FadR/GntR family transcriptional regulator [Ktedonobacterales bacterium]|nr:FadR/GntR family transcriptional regulator [Ktedonobacterales bacterium]